MLLHLLYPDDRGTHFQQRRVFQFWGIFKLSNFATGVKSCDTVGYDMSTDLRLRREIHEFQPV